MLIYFLAKKLFLGHKADCCEGALKLKIKLHYVTLNITLLTLYCGLKPHPFSIWAPPYVEAFLLPLDNSLKPLLYRPGAVCPALKIHHIRF